MLFFFYVVLLCFASCSTVKASNGGNTVILEDVPVTEAPTSDNSGGCPFIGSIYEHKQKQGKVLFTLTLCCVVFSFSLVTNIIFRST